MKKINYAAWGAHIAKVFAGIQIVFLMINLYFHYFISFKGVVWAGKASSGLFEQLPNNKGFFTMTPSQEMVVYIKVNNWFDLIDTYFVLQMICANMKYVLIGFFWFQISKLFQKVAEKSIFDNKTINTLQYITVALILIPIFNHLAKYTMTQYVLNHVTLFSIPKTIKFWEGFHFGDLLKSDWIPNYLFMPIIFMAFLEIFRHGSDIQSENELTV